jgi:hypothetical protein
MDEMATTAALAPLVVGLVEALRRVVSFEARSLPAAAIVIGVALGILTKGANTWEQAIIAGIITGLTASGLYSGVKATVGR